MRYFLERRRAWRNRGEIEYSTDLMVSEDDYYSHEVPSEVAQQRLASLEREEFIQSFDQQLQRCRIFADVQLDELKKSLVSLEGGFVTIQRSRRRDIGDIPFHSRQHLLLTTNHNTLQ
ncbi:hypothetical protein MHU86_24143 [Fragilaria crotonensis]|nr:hypothetical protein MHU86_24143 [Fragilaria crotonensis]